jgi:WD40 repeat protein
LRQVAFIADSNRLMTLADDPRAQVHIWDIQNLKAQGILPLPDVQPWFMSRGTRWIVGQTPEPPKVAVFDASTGTASVCDQIDPWRMLCISEDKKEIAAYGRGNSIDVYALDGATCASVRSIPLEQVPVAIEFLVGQDAWSIVVSDIKGNVRLLAEDGKDLIPPVTMPRVVERLLPIAAGTRVLVAGEGLLAVVDLATGKSQMLSDEAATSHGRTRYSSLAVNRTGTLAAAARIGLQNAERPYEIELWDLEQGRKVKALAGNDAQVGTMSFSDDSRRLASGDTLGFVQIWNLESKAK